jgi:hypothetical protein
VPFIAPRTCVPRRIALALRGRHLPDHELALGDLLLDVLELLLMAFLLAELLGPWQVLAPDVALPVVTWHTGSETGRGRRE